MRHLLFLLSALVFALAASAVKHEDFKECHQTSFCRRLRSIADRQASSPADFASPYSVGTPRVTPGTEGASASWTLPLSSGLYPEITFELRVDVLKDDIVRLRADEVGSASPWRRYNETAKWALVGEPQLAPAKISTQDGKTTITYGKGTGKDALALEIIHAPLRITMTRGGVAQIIVNERSLFHMEHYRVKETDPELPEGEADAPAQDNAQTVLETPVDRSWFEEADNDMFEETWKRWKDTKPKGPEGLSLDFTFPGVQHVFGLPEHASPLSLPSTKGKGAYYKEPYRLWNVDIFEYEADSPMALYGAVPLLHAHGKESTVAVLNLVGSETWVDVEHDKDAVRTHWVSESGIVDVLLLPGPRPTDLFKQYAGLTGPAQMPAQFATAYHQCRWNYNDQDDVITVQDEFDKADMPLDVTWLDIEYSVDHRYFDWREKQFPDPVKMLDQVASKGRKMVAIVDPHVKKVDSYRVYTESRDKDLLIKKANGDNYDGWCWPGSSVWVDYFNPKSWDWWTSMFSYNVWPQSSKDLHIWNDMNEPSVFDGPEISMPRDNLHAGGWEHRDVHNINGMLFHNQTQRAVAARDSPELRPFVLSRSFFAGSQRFGAIWTGDNMGTWDHFAGETAMLLSNSIAGMSFVGADVGGFFGNPSPEMLVRWYQAGAFMPFFRAHAHLDTKRREPYLFDEPYKSQMRDALRMRYQLLPTWYTAFHDAATNGYPVIWPQYAVHPTDETGFAVDDQYYVGDSGLLFKPVITEGATETTVYLAANEPYYNWFNHRLYVASPKPRNVTIPTPLDVMPLLIEGGHIVPSRQRVRRSSALMWQDPVTLTVAVGRDGSAVGQLYLDDGETFAYQQGAYVHRAFALTPDSKAGATLKSAQYAPHDAHNAYAKKIAHVTIERITVLGLGTQPNAVTVAGKPVQFTFQKATKGKDATASVLTIKNPGVAVVDDWEVVVA